MVMKMVNQLHVAVLEDDRDLAEEISWRLQKMGMQTVILGSAAALDIHLVGHQIDILVLDLGLPDEDGISVACRLSRREDLRIVMLTARHGLKNRIAGINAGADVYLTKPVDLNELVSVINRLAVRLPVVRRLSWGLKIAQSRLLSPSQINLTLTTRECLILRCFAQAPEQTIARQVIENMIWGYSDESTDQRLLVNMSRLRAKLRQGDDTQEVIRTCWGTGYQFTQDLTIQP